MKQSFVPVFQTNYFSNGYLTILSLCVLAGLIVALVVWLSGNRSPTAAKMIFLGFWMAVWLVVFVVPLGALISHGHKYKNALEEGQSGVVEGHVLLVRQQPKSGAGFWLQSPRRASVTLSGNTPAQRAYATSAPTNAPGDLVKIGDKEFVLNFYSLGLGYQQTAVHGGVLTNGAYARLHYVGNTIVKVEVRE